MNGDTNWILIFTALASIFSFLALLTEYYYRVHRPRAKDKEEKRDKIYKPLRKDLDALVESVRAREPFSPPFNWKTVEGDVSSQLFGRLQKLFEEETGNYHKWLKHNQDFIRFEGYFYLKSQLPKLEKEFKSLGVGGLEFELHKSIVAPLLEGEKITLRWLEDNSPELHENLMKCESHKKLKRLLDYLNEENPCIVAFRKAEQDLLQSAKELKCDLKSF